MTFIVTDTAGSLLPACYVTVHVAARRPTQPALSLFGQMEQRNQKQQQSVKLFSIQ